MKQSQKIVLISCSSTKQPLPAGETVCAKDLYTSSLFRKSMQYAEMQHSDRIFILSAKHGLLRLDDRIGTYNEALNNKPAAERRVWAGQVLAQLREEGCDLSRDKFVILAGKKYYQYLLGEGRIEKYCLPYEHKKIGETLQFLNNKLNRK